MSQVVLFHGFLGGPRAWDEVVSLVAPTLPVHAEVLPGHGRRPWFPGAGVAAPATFDEVIDRVATRLPPGASHVVGYSLGARVALGVAARHPARVHSLVLVGVNTGLEDDAERGARRAADEELARQLDLGDLARFVDA